MDEVQVKHLYQIVIDSRGLPYLDAEERLVKLAESAVPFLEEQSQLSTGLTQLVTQVVLQRIAGNQKFTEALEYFDKVQQRAAETPMKVPPPESVAEYLFQHFGDTVSSLLGVYLVKLAGIWPAWKILGVILYLGKLSSAAAADPLIHFLSTASNDHQRKMALEALASVGDATTLDKIESELKPIGTSRQLLEQAAEQIRAKLESQL
jgi:HEAT repeat protein